jgi:hypothetical protein
LTAISSSAVVRLEASAGTGIMASLNIPCVRRNFDTYLQCCGSGMFIPEPDFLPIPDPGSQIQDSGSQISDPGSKNLNKREV